VGNATQTAIAEIADGFGMAEAGVIVPASMAVVSGCDPRYGRAPFVNSLFLMQTGGAGAPREDAWLTTVHIGDLGLCYLDSVELDELRYPLRVERRGIVPDSEGAGKFRGAPAGFAAYAPVGTTMEAWFASDGMRNVPVGVRGGGPAGGATQAVRRADGTLDLLPPCGGVVLQPGETLECTCCGGGGYGDPRERDPARVREDVAEGWITAARARDVYGVVPDADREPDAAANGAIPLRA
jgi:N-methylhydantoinase B